MKRCASIDELLPSFRPVVRSILTALAERGFSPVVNETYRSPERAAMLAVDPDGDGPRQAPGVRSSMHTLRAAVDFRCGEHGYDCHEHGCAFFEALGEVAEGHRCTWGGKWHRRDAPHVQAVTVAEQQMLRELTSQVERDAFVADRLRGALIP